MHLQHCNNLHTCASRCTLDSSATRSSLKGLKGLSISMRCVCVWTHCIREIASQIAFRTQEQQNHLFALYMSKNTVSQTEMVKNVRFPNNSNVLHCSCIASALHLHCSCIASTLKMHVYCIRIASALHSHCICIAPALHLLYRLPFSSRFFLPSELSREKCPSASSRKEEMNK